jgi:heme-degrading monooxygenase HmoA
VIARLWYGTTAADQADEYTAYLERTGLAEYQATEGNVGAFVLRRVAEEHAQFLVISLWEDMEAVKRFAGPDPDRAVYYPEDERFLQALTPTLNHYQVVASI